MQPRSSSFAAVVCITLTCLIAIVFASSHPAAAGEMASKLDSGARVAESADSRVIRYGFILSNDSGKVVRDVDFWIYAPAKQTSWQRTASTHSNQNYSVITDSSENQIFHYKFDVFPPYGTKVINIQSAIEFSRRPVELEVNTEGYLQGDTYIQVDEPEIIDLAQELKASDARQTIYNTYLWVHHNIRYSGYVKQDRGALYALTHREGDCTEFSYLLVALLRANGIPARAVGGFVYMNNKILDSNDYHNWVEVYMDGAWRVVDPQKGRFMEQEDHYIAFRIITDNYSLAMLPTNTHRFTVGSKMITAVMK